MPLLFERVLGMNGLEMDGWLIIHVIHMSGTGIIESGIYGLYRGNDFGEMLGGKDPLIYIPLHIVYLDIY